MEQLEQLRDADGIEVLLLDLRDEADFEAYHITGGKTMRWLNGLTYLCQLGGLIPQVSLHSAIMRGRHEQQGSTHKWSATD